MISYSIYVVDDEQSLAKGLAMSLAKDYQTSSMSTQRQRLVP